MKLLGIALTGFAICSVTSAALAQNAAVTGEKKGYQQLDPDIYGSVEVRHFVLRAQNGDRIASEIPKLSVRPTLGLKLFGGKVRSAFTLNYGKAPGTTVVSRAAMFNETMWMLYQGTHLSITPYSYNDFGEGGKEFAFSYTGVNFGAKNTYESAVGKVVVSAYIEPKVELESASRSKDPKFRVIPRNETSSPSLAFDESGAIGIEKRDPTFVDDAGVAVRLSSAQVTKLFTGLSVDVFSQWKPKYVAFNKDNGSVGTDFDGYERRSLTTTRWTLGWAASDKITFTNSIAYFMGGLFEYPIENALATTNHELDKNRWENRFSVNTLLF